MRRAAALCAAIALGAAIPGTAALGAPVTLDARALVRTPGVIAVDRQNTTVVQFCDAIDWLAYKAPWLQAQVSPRDKRVLLLDANAESGQTAMSVWVTGQGAPLQLLVRVSPTTLDNHVYFVDCGGAAQAAGRPPAGGAPSPAPQAGTHASGGHGSAAQGGKAQAGAKAGTAPSQVPAAWDAFIAGLSPAQWAMLQAVIADPSDQKTLDAFAASLSPQQREAWAVLGPSAGLAPRQGSAGATAGGSAPQGVSQPGGAAPAVAGAPSWLSFQLLEARGQDGGGLVIPYVVTNTGTVTVVLDVARASVVDGRGARVDGVRIVRQDTSGYEGRVPPGGTESGTIFVPGPPSGDLEVRWAAVALNDSGTTYMLAQTVHRQ